MARTVPSWSWTTWAILASVPTVYSSVGSAMSSFSACRCVTSAMGASSATAWLSALTDFSRPTWRGTIISGKMTVSRRATRASVWRGPSLVARRRRSRDRFVLVVIRLSCWGCDGLGRSIRRRRPRRPGRPRGTIRAREERLQDPGTHPLLDLEEDADAGQVDAEVLGQVADPEDPPDVILGVEADVGWRARRADQALLLVDAQRSRMHADDAGGHADDVDRSTGISPVAVAHVWPALLWLPLAPLRHQIGMRKTIEP